MSRPPCTIVPSSWVSRPAMIRRSVVLPQPDGPRKIISWLRSTARAMPDSAVNFPKRLVIPESLRYGSSAETAGAVTACPAGLLDGRRRAFVAPANTGTQCLSRTTLDSRFRGNDALFLRRRFGVVALGPLGENLVAVFRFPGEIVLGQPFLVIGRNEVQRLGDTGNRNHGEVLGKQSHRLRRREPVHQLARGFDFLGRLHDARGLEV